MKKIQGKTSAVKETLLRIGAIKEDRITNFSEKTRDNKDLDVFIDKISGVIFIDDYYVGNDEYISGAYRKETPSASPAMRQTYEDVTDSERRYRAYRQFVVGRNICDFGCGAGNFLKLAQPVANALCGVELEESRANDLNASGIPCFSSLRQIEQPLDLITMFHCFEHLPDPAAILEEARHTLKPTGEGVLIIEVPHARDFLIDTLSIKPFIDFTLWSQHLILHTRDSLRSILFESGFSNILIEGVQRYSLANHLQWLSAQKPGGHKSRLSALQTPELTEAYAAALCKIDATDTLVAIATT